MECYWKNGCHVWSCRHHRGSSCFLGARTRCNNTAEMIAVVEALSFLGSVVQLHVIQTRFFTPIMLLVCARARFKPAHMFNWRSHFSGRRCASNTGCGLLCNTCTATLGTWVSFGGKTNSNDFGGFGN